MNNIEVRYLKRTCLIKDAYAKTILHYTKILELKFKVLIVFDNRIKTSGLHTFDIKKNHHTIRISPEKAQLEKPDIFNDLVIRVGKNEEKWNIISTTLHELRHAAQYEESSDKYYYDADFNAVSELNNPSVSDWYSRAEIEARVYESLHIHHAIKLYNSSCK